MISTVTENSRAARAGGDQHQAGGGPLAMKVLELLPFRTQDQMYLGGAGWMV